ncbi:metallophosphoesterase family protein [Aequorivita lipolytica]|uniref:Serine/threonine protein phosphatase n=1 Tax=Aequorivita lipolytica TaxID=153267 RepID=A0A5C6YS10_9FLAO|nr:metallophosphoesterase family protein [Aequorivita lipolytica]TXD70196.1 serine/threonine protein phosphatase [Aequorivita lipolytica]SRX50615.1 Bis(5'-nucleosyl)-tetraphosphatase PrpE [asymmetrical] [Aequorivita lipolytica]
MKTVVVGDIHGGFKALKQLLETTNLPKDTKYIFVGDYVDGWSESAEVVSYLIDFSEINDCIFLRGNHDELLYKYLKFGESNPMWLSQGGKSSIKSYAKLSKSEKEKNVKFFENLENYYIDSENRLFLHAGFTNQHGPQHEYYPNLVYWDRTLWEMVCAMDAAISEEDDKYPKRLKLFKEIYIGHTPVTRVGFEKPANFANVWNVDTGAAFKGKISMLAVDSKEIWQSEPVHLLYPNEKGRN